MVYDISGKRVFVAGHRGMVGSAIVRQLEHLCEVVSPERGRVDFRNQEETAAWVRSTKPQAAIVAAAKVGGILANDRMPAQFLYDNLMIEANIIKACADAGVEKLLFLGSSCIYPKHASLPIKEEALLTGPLEPTNEWYAIAKIAGIRLTQAFRREYGFDFISAMPCNLYGPHDNFDLDTSHVLPALLRKAHQAKILGAESLVIWGSGRPMREFLFVDDCAGAIIYLMREYSGESHINVGSEEEISISDLAALVCEVVGFDGPIVCDPTKPDGTLRKVMSSERLRSLGWSRTVTLRDGLEKTYRWACDNGQL